MARQHISRGLGLAVTACGLWLGTGPFAGSPAFGGYTFNTLASFNKTNGANPDAGLTLSGNTLYGTTQGGGAYNYGTVFSVPLAGGSPTTLATFNWPIGANPDASLTLSGSTLYGTTQSGGASGQGTVFSVPLAGGSPTTLVSFNVTNGELPIAGLTLSGNTLYGTTYYGGASNDGTVFSVPLTGGSPTTLASFGGTNGAHPVAGLTLSGNTLYGTTERGGFGYNGDTYSGYGTVFSIPLSGGPPTTLATFNNTNGKWPDASLTLSGNTLYGTAQLGGANGDGIIFSVPLSGGSPTTLATFNNTNGEEPGPGLTLSGTTLYGTAYAGGAGGYGTIFSVPLAGGAPTTLVNFNSTNGANPNASLIFSGNTLYGTTYNGGASNFGTVFSLTPKPTLSLTAAAPSAFGSKLGTLTLPSSGSATFTATPKGYLAINGFNPSTSTEIYALKITDSIPANLLADLADAVSELNAASYPGYSLIASTTDPTGHFGTGYNFYLTITNPTLGTTSPYFGFDFTQLNGISDTLSVTAVAVPEPTTLSLLAIGAITLPRRRRDRSNDEAAKRETHNSLPRQLLR